MSYTQVELEQEMIAGGKERARRMLARNEEEGRAANNPYANPVYDRFVAPLGAQIEAALSNPLPGRRGAYVGYLRALEPHTSAYIAVRVVLTKLLEDPSTSARALAHTIGRQIQSEQVLRQFAHLAPDEYWALTQELDRRHSQAPLQRMRLAIRNMHQLDLEPIDWGKGARDQVGAYMVESLRTLGMIEAWHKKNNNGGRFKTETHIRLSWEVMELLDEVRELLDEAMPYYMPCVEKPLDWPGLHGGGYHTPAMQKNAPVAVLQGNPGGGDLTELVGALNVLQSVRWQVNVPVLNIARALARTTETKELVSTTPPPQPAKPAFLEAGNIKRADMTEEQQAEFKAWRRAMAEWHTQMKLKGQAYGRMYNAFRIADKFQDQPNLYFVYRADFRGRFYPYTTGINPQGSDLQKALLRFAEGKPLRTKAAQDWFMIHGANRFGVDKEPYEDRIKWVEDNARMILDIAESPLDNRQWLDADAPFQFLAWCLEFAEWDKYGAAFESHLPVGMDGSCNGLQNFSAMLRDEVGAASTNIIPSSRPNDIYRDVAGVAYLLVQQQEPGPERDWWLAFGLDRSSVKRNVMTLPYGSTQFSGKAFILDYLNEKAPDLAYGERVKLANWLGPIVWEAIAQVVVKARLAMDWLQECAGLILKGGHKTIRWRTPTGFIALQDYRKVEFEGRIRVNLFGGAQWSLSRSTDEACGRQHRNGIAPNFIHSMDAAHMQRVANRCREVGIHSLAMIHDDFGTHAADAAEFSQIIRQEFLSMYRQEDWLLAFAAPYVDEGILLPLPPESGNLDLSQVLDSKYFFG